MTLIAQVVRCSAALKTGQWNSACQASIYSSLVEVYGPVVMSMQMVQRWCQQFREGRTSVLDDARPHTAGATVNHIPTFSWERLDHAPYGPVAPSDFHFLSILKRTLEGSRFTSNEDAEAAVRTRDTDFHQQGFFKLVKRWDKCINVS
jgi:hypothetical protein